MELLIAQGNCCRRSCPLCTVLAALLPTGAAVRQSPLSFSRSSFQLADHSFEPVRGETVPEGMRRHALPDPGHMGGDMHSAVELARAKDDPNRPCRSRPGRRGSVASEKWIR